jgi:hypothetical protein
MICHSALAVLVSSFQIFCHCSFAAVLMCLIRAYFSGLCLRAVGEFSVLDHVMGTLLKVYIVHSQWVARMDISLFGAPTAPYIGGVRECEGGGIFRSSFFGF